LRICYENPKRSLTVQEKGLFPALEKSPVRLAFLAFFDLFGLFWGRGGAPPSPPPKTRFLVDFWSIFDPFLTPPFFGRFLTLF